MSLTQVMYCYVLKFAESRSCVLTKKMETQGDDGYDSQLDHGNHSHCICMLYTLIGCSLLFFNSTSFKNK